MTLVNIDPRSSCSLISQRGTIFTNRSAISRLFNSYIYFVTFSLFFFFFFVFFLVVFFCSLKMCILVSKIQSLYECLTIFGVMPLPEDIVKLTLCNGNIQRHLSKRPFIKYVSRYRAISACLLLEFYPTFHYKNRPI